MDRLLELLARIGTDTPLTAEERIEVRELIAENLAAIDRDNVTDDTLAALRQLAEARTAIDALDAEIAQADEARRTEAAALLAQIEAEADDGDGEDDAADADDAASDSGSDTPAETPPTVPQENTETVTVETPDEAVAAAAPPARVVRATPLASVRRAPARRAGQSDIEGLPLSIVASVPSPEAQINVGARVPDAATLARMLGDTAVNVRRASTDPRGDGTNVLVASLQWGYGEELTLDDRIDANMAKIAAARENARTAAGGLCSPTQVRYDLVNLSTPERRVPDAMVRFGAERGGVRFNQSPQIGDLSGAVSQWTVQNDIDAGTAGAPDPEKPCLRVTCGAAQEVFLYGTPLCLTFGNLGARANPEQVRQNIDVALAAHARLSDNLLLTAIDAGSTAVTTAADAGALGPLAAVTNVVAYLRSFFRMSDATAVEVIFPAWFRDAIRADMLRQQAGDGLEARQITNAQIDALFANLGASVTWHLDGLAGQQFADQGAGVISGFPDTVVWRAYPAGTWGFLDGGTLDLGTVRDSTLNKTNDYQQFQEGFEAAARFGPKSLVITSTFEPTGVRSAPAVLAGID